MIPIMNKLEKQDGTCYEICDYILIRGDSGFQSVDSPLGGRLQDVQGIQDGHVTLQAKNPGLSSKPATLDAKMEVFLNH